MHRPWRPVLLNAGVTAVAAAVAAAALVAVAGAAAAAAAAAVRVASAEQTVSLRRGTLFGCA